MQTCDSFLTEIKTTKKLQNLHLVPVLVPTVEVVHHYDRGQVLKSIANFYIVQFSAQTLAPYAILGRYPLWCKALFGNGDCVISAKMSCWSNIIFI